MGQLFEGPRAGTANSTGAGSSGVQTAGRRARLEIAKIAKSQTTAAFLEQSMGSLPRTPAPLLYPPLSNCVL